MGDSNLVSFVDLTAHKIADDALRESETKFRLVAETAPCAIWILEGQGLVYVNRYAEILSGYTREELLSMNPWTLVDPELRDMNYQRSMARLRGENPEPRYQFKIRTKGGEVRWLDFSGARTQFEGKPAILATAFDITAIKRAEAAREAAIAKAKADQERVLAETLSQAKQAEAQRDLEVKKAEYAEMVKKQQAQADKAYEIQANVMQQQVRAEEVTIHQVEKEHEVKVQEAEILRRERELTATVLKQAEYERKRIETLAEAERQRTIVEAEGKAAAIRAQGEAEAEIIFKKGEAEAKAMNVKAEAYQEFNQAAIVDKLISNMPEVVKALAAPLANVDRITVVSTGNGDSAGMSKITGDMAKMAAQIPALFETLSGMPLNELLAKVRLIGDKAPKPDGKSKSAGL